MNAISLHFASGLTFFWGIVLLVALSAARLCLRKPAFRSARRLATIVAILLVALSATPLPYWLYAVWALPVAAMLASLLPAPTCARLRRAGLSLAVIAMSLTALALELPYIATGGSEGPAAHTLVVIADSIAAGVGDETTTWPAGDWARVQGAPLIPARGSAPSPRPRAGTAAIPAVPARGRARSPQPPTGGGADVAQGDQREPWDHAPPRHKPSKRAAQAHRGERSLTGTARFGRPL